MDVITYIGIMAGFVSSLGIVGAGAIWLYQKVYGEKKELKRQQEANKRNKELMDTLQPLNTSIELLRTDLADSQRDRKNLNRITDGHAIALGVVDNRLDNHDIKISVIESQIKKERY